MVEADDRNANQIRPRYFRASMDKFAAIVPICTRQDNGDPAGIKAAVNRGLLEILRTPFVLLAGD